MGFRFAQPAWHSAGLLAFFVASCSIAPDRASARTEVSCNVSDENAWHIAERAALEYKLEFFPRGAGYSHIKRYGTRIQYYGARHFHSETIVWMRCDGIIDSVHYGNNQLYARCKLAAPGEPMC